MARFDRWFPRGVDAGQCRLLFATKMTLAARSGNGFGLRIGAGQKTSAHPLRTSFLWNLLIGAALALLLVLPVSLLLGLTSFLSLLFLMFFLTMLTNYATLLLDPKDRLVYGVRGVNDRTLNAVRVGLVGLFLGVTLLAQAGPGLVVLTIRFGPLVGLAAALGTVLLGVNALLLALMVYLLVLRFFDGERLKNILNLVQITLVVGIYLLSQLPNLLPTDFPWASLLAIKWSWWWLLAIPAWFAGLPLLVQQATPLTLGLTALSLLSTVVLAGLYLTHASKFEQSLEKLDTNNASVRHAGRYFRGCRRLFAGTGDEAAYFTLGWRMLQTQRDYKLRVYPQLAYGLILPVIIAGNFLRGLPWGQAQHYLVYLSLGIVFGLPTAMWFLAYSSQPAAMAIFRYLPLKSPGLLLRGIVKAVYARIFLPLQGLLCLVGLALAREHAVTPIVLSLSLSYLLALGYGRLLGPKRLPFSAEFGPEKGMQGGALGFALVMAALLIIGAIIFINGTLFLPWLDLAITTLAGGGAWLTARSYRNIRL